MLTRLGVHTQSHLSRTEHVVLGDTPRRLAVAGLDRAKQFLMLTQHRLPTIAIGERGRRIGIDAQTGQPRLTFGIDSLLDGVDVVIVVIALFALGEAFRHALTGTGGTPVTPLHGRALLSRNDFRRSWPAWLRGTAFGFPIGALPAGGAEVPTFLSYATEKKLSKHPEEFGHGAIEGVVGPEAANNAAAAGVLIPLLTIGLPTSATAAVILVAFQSYGLHPGPELFSESSPLVWTLIASLYIGNVMLLVLNLPIAKVWTRLLTIPAYGIYAGVLVFATLGTFATGGARCRCIQSVHRGVKNNS